MINKLKTKNKAYTLLEILIVVSIITVMIWMFWYFTPNKNDKQIDFWKTSSKNIYNKISKSHLNIIRNHTEIFWSWKDIEDIDMTTILFTWIDNQILIISEQYNDSKSYEITKEFTYKNDKYINITTWEQNKIKIDNNNSINYNNTTTTKVCELAITNCIPISKIIFNKAAQTISQKFCLDFSWSICNKWEK